jgi:hypothetical protein
LAEMVRHREQHAESDQHSEPERCSDQHGVHFVFPNVRREHILCAWKAPRLGQEILKFERIEAVSDPMRELIEDLWPELLDRLPPKRPQG